MVQRASTVYAVLTIVITTVVLLLRVRDRLLRIWGRAIGLGC